MRNDPVDSIACRSIRSGPTLRDALKSFLRCASRGNKTAIYWSAIRGLSIRIYRHRRAAEEWDPNFCSDLDFIIELTYIIQQFAGKRWAPKSAALQFHPLPREVASIHFPNTNILLDQAETWLDLPRSFLTLRRQPDNTVILQSSAPGRNAMANDPASFIHTLKRKLREHSNEGYPDLDAAAQLLCMSVRTLQRNLARAGMTYSKVLEYARLEAATEMLATPNLKIIDIAYSLGYEDPSHFSRAFRRLVGQSPREFRTRQLAKAAAV